MRPQEPPSSVFAAQIELWEAPSKAGVRHLMPSPFPSLAPSCRRGGANHVSSRALSACYAHGRQPRRGAAGARAHSQLGNGRAGHASARSRAAVSRNACCACVPGSHSSPPASTLTSQAQGFVQTEMRKAAMALHTRDQSKEGKEAAQKPMMQWTPTRKGYLQFLVDSRHVYGAVEEIVNERAELAALRNTGLERTAALDKDIAWMVSEGCEPTVPSAAATGYAAELKSLSTPAFVCHYYNYYFAHTAGGRMIGKQMSDMLLDGRVLEFYKVRTGVRSVGCAPLTCCGLPLCSCTHVLMLCSAHPPHARAVGRRREGNAKRCEATHR